FLVHVGEDWLIRSKISWANRGSINSRESVFERYEKTSKFSFFFNWMMDLVRDMDFNDYFGNLGGLLLDFGWN
ncbi:hypothetical protein PJI17_32065, partial [Mycobacterium kansasii]